MYSNADGVCSISKLAELRYRIQEKKPEIVCITETKLTKITNDEALGLEQYNIWRKERTSKEGGGVMMMTKKRTHSNRSTFENHICRNHSD